MTGIVSGSFLGLYGNTLTTGAGSPFVGRGTQSDSLYVNTTTGNLVIRSQDEYLASLGLDLALVRTYNSQGELSDDNGDNWQLNIHQRLHGLTGTVNAAGSSITKTYGDGAEAVFTYDVARGCYVSPVGDGAHDTLTYSAGVWIWTDGSDTAQEIYDEQGRLINARDQDANTNTYIYTGALLTEIRSASDDGITLNRVYFDYSGNNLTQIRSVTSDGSQVLTSYRYDAQNRLTQVLVDLTPENPLTLQDSDSDGVYETVNSQTYVTTYTYDGTSARDRKSVV